MGSEFSTPSEIPLCTEKHDSFKHRDVIMGKLLPGFLSKEREDYLNNLIKDGDPQYLEVIYSYYSFGNSCFNSEPDKIYAYIREVTSGWTKWKFPVTKGKAQLTIQFLKTFDKGIGYSITNKEFQKYLNCGYMNINYFIEHLTADIDPDFVKFCIEKFYSTENLQKLKEALLASKIPSKHQLSGYCQDEIERINKLREEYYRNVKYPNPSRRYSYSDDRRQEDNESTDWDSILEDQVDWDGL